MVPQILKDVYNCLYRVRAHLAEHGFMPAGRVTVGSGGKIVKMTPAARAVRNALKVTEYLPETKFVPKHGWPSLANQAAKDVGNTGKGASALLQHFAKGTLHARELNPGKAVNIVSVHETTSVEKVFKDFWFAEKPKNNEELHNIYSVLFREGKFDHYSILKNVPTAAQIKATGIALPKGWNGLRVWAGKAAGRFDSSAHGNWKGGGEILYIDWSHSANSPVKSYLMKTGIASNPTGWADFAVIPTVIGQSVSGLQNLEKAPFTQKDAYTDVAPPDPEPTPFVPGGTNIMAP